ncbi:MULTISPECIES: HmuY family protein [Marinobacter]|uniref:HmuY family protein n=1 Tax=Marinobacter xiaoshiensis TaxID=3073652 RepID=A0ABU2HC81_9GAMM|nr:HmuY family protein [Marinobacter sp. F60267]MDS1308673.1 HmuY family protein [Marinobacter sp. F60267]
MSGIYRGLGLATAVVLLAGCGGSDNSLGGSDETDGSAQTKRQVVDAKSYSQATYLNLNTGATMQMTVEEAQGRTDWHLSFKRDTVQVNGGASGAGNVAGAVANSQGKFYDDAGEPNFNLLVNATASSEEEALLAEYPEPGSRDWVSDSITNSFGSDWYSYNPDGGIMNANSDNGWLVRSAEGNSYARMRMIEMDFPTRTGEGIKSFTVAFDVQVPGTDTFTQTATFTGSIGAAGGESCFDFDAGSSVDCETSASWDVKLGFAGRDIYLRSNSGTSGDGDGGVFGPFEWTVLEGYLSATIAPASGEDLKSRYAADTTSGVFKATSWYAYDQAGGHLLRPNFRVYLIDTDSTDPEASVYAVQIVGYYGDDGVSGQPIVRWTNASLTAAE